MGIENSVAVGLGEIRVSHNPADILVAYGLGSCVGVSLYDPVVRMGGLLHAVLPERVAHAERSPKYVDIGIAELVRQMEINGCVRGRLTVRLAGGAHMLTANRFRQALNIGERNVAAALAALEKLGLEVSAQDVGGSLGRTVRLYVATGRLTVRTMGCPEREL